MDDRTKPSRPTKMAWDYSAPPGIIEITEPPKKRSCFSCSTVFIGLVALLLLAVYFFAPGRTNILLLGIDRTPEGTALGRTDTMILTTVMPLEPYVGMLSIPRDLWVELPDGGANRINTAHYFAESNSPGTGPEAAMEVVRSNFGVDVDHYVRFQFEGFKDFVDSIGGIEIELEVPMAGYAPGTYVLNGEEALAFVRDRAGTDDFFRMNQGQFFLTSMLKQLMNPTSWTRLPGAVMALMSSVETDLPIWQWPRIGLALIRAGASGIDTRTISREMVNGFTTASGAQVLAPNWAVINPVLLEMFNQ
ncbi:MAG: hypothetical protein GTO18_00970 [Anaerolineales bacterium]|nr:hypothetical protein [Anaerolineales bacterium]